MAKGAETADESTQTERPMRSMQPVMPGGWPIDPLSAIAFVVGAEMYVSGRKDEFSSIFSVEWRHSAGAVRRHAPASDVICFGTSLTRTGLGPRVLEERLGMPSHNFAGSGSQPFACDLNLRNAKASWARPAPAR